MKSKLINRNVKKNLANDAYEELWRRIFNNEIKPGELINESALAEDLGISRTPVREALRMLTSEDIIETKDGIGTYVKMLSYKNIKDIFEVRKVLEVLAVKTSLYHIEESDIIELENELMDIGRKYNMSILKREEFTAIDTRVHQLIFNKSENEYAKSIFEGMNLKIRQYQYVSYQSLNNNEESISQHLEILRLLRNKDLDNLIIALENHIDWSLKYLLM